ncbi:hypothetical protein HME9304_02535 [Flagellimonas maritima]|uniref:Uncharacterized protein n=1 Tax=Flagellimonas maritima TaxID=1383885 RepID=A0A2Z4LUD4_9FLAO|nr:DUF2911 domain-containing protein [Allomuricauda aurantiaca]AWX45515.1 hypothetical protein HME9304_02535 [Allomuricauda aurantiaca]
MKQVILKSGILLKFMFLVFSTSFYSQIKHPKASPFSEVHQQLGLSKISVQYSRPATKGRTIFGGLVPYGRIWRVGANESTKIIVDADMEVLGNPLPKGIYALYAFPEEDSWQIAFHTNTSHWGDGRKDYDPKEDLFRINVIPKQISYHQENLLIAFDSITHNSVNMELIWASTKVMFPFTVDTHAQMEQEIAKQILENPTAQTYYEAARYLQEQGKSYKQALEYLRTAIEKGGDTYYFHRVKSLVEAALGQYENAINSAQKSLALAQEQEKDEFVRMNQNNIKRWKKLL